MRFRLGKKVKIIPSKKISGAFNHGKVIGIELTPSAYYLGHRGEKEYLSRFTVPRYKVAYVDCVTKHGSVEWFNENELE